MSKIKKIIGYIWAGPLTVLGFVFVLFFGFLCAITWHGIENGCLIWRLRASSGRIGRFLLTFSNRSFGHVIIIANRLNLKTPLGQKVFLHQLQHVHHAEVLGIFYPICFFMLWIIIKLACKNSDPFYSNPFEIDARRGANQFVDIEGFVSKLKKIKSSNSRWH